MCGADSVGQIPDASSHDVAGGRHLKEGAGALKSSEASCAAPTVSVKTQDAMSPIVAGN